jgi:hypothetical protein
MQHTSRPAWIGPSRASRSNRRIAPPTNRTSAAIGTRASVSDGSRIRDSGSLGTSSRSVIAASRQLVETMLLGGRLPSPAAPVL